MLCMCHWIVLYIVHVTAFFSGHSVYNRLAKVKSSQVVFINIKKPKEK